MQLQNAVVAESAANTINRLTWVWFAKRSALWVLILSMGIGAACALYAIAEEAPPAAASAARPQT